MTKVFDFPEMLASLNNWAEFLNDSPVAITIMERFKVDVLERYPSLKWPRDILNDFSCFMAAVYHGGYNAGQVRGAQDYAATQPKPPQAIKVWEVHSTVNELGTTGEKIGVYSDQIDAKAAAVGKGWWGSEGTIVPHDALRYNGVVYILHDQVDATDLNVNLPARIEEKRQAALAKLTLEEQKLLGIDLKK